ncbi:zinc finger protein 782-like [Calliphora vicina]|uniref:zinc finger protein 782-like n=1 Tax=Calliphora vicina TaxID=7373 RepID=UPI00325C1A07
MDLKSIQGSISFDKFQKCGEVYRSPIISEKQYRFLSCIYCKDISWELDTFLQHLDNAHHPIDDICSNLYKEEDPIEENVASNGNVTESKMKQSSAKPITEPRNNKENDPLDETRYDYTDFLPVTVKEEEASESIENNDVNLNRDSNSNSNASHNNEILEIYQFEYDDNNSSDEDYEPDKATTDDENYDNAGEYLNEEYDKDDEDNNDDEVDDDIELFDLKFENKKTNLKRFTKNREFIKAVINAYKKQNILWDIAHKNKKRSSPEKQTALKIILNEINEKFDISATLQQIERIIKRLKLRFIHHSRLRDKGESYKPLWFYDLLTFLEPHLKENKLRSGIYKQLNDNQFLSLLKLLKENECFWNENNIYHTSVINKQDILKSMTNDFSKMCEYKEFNADIMQNTIDEIIEMAREENANKMSHIASNKNDEYQSSNKFYKDIQFLLPHVGPFKCNYCPKTFTDIYAYKFHISRHEGTKPFQCMLCPRELTHKKEFVCHLRRHTKECPFQCEECDKSFPSKKEWHRHVIKHGSKPYVCELCADSFYTQHQLTNHMKNHNNIRDHVCPECGKGFTHRGLLRQHLQTHNKTKCVCSLCDNIYSNPRSLRKHYVRVHESGQEPSAASMAQYNCQICKITFLSIQDAKQHRKEHKQSNPAERKHVCDICGHHFAYPRNLADHKKTHSNIRDQVCDVCGKAFTNTNLLNQHKNVHTGEKFVCKACGKDYAHYRGLCRHITKAHGTNIRDLDALLEKQKLAPTPQ